MVMGHCDLEIVLDRPERTYRAGDRISGFVGVTVNKDCTCRGLNVQLGWRTHGRGNRARGEQPPEVVFQGDWTTGEQHVHPFEFVVPDGPLTYHGTYLNVDWAIKAWADIPWALDPKADVDFVLEPPEEPRPLVLGPSFSLDDDRPASGRMVMTAFGVFFALFTIPFFAFGIMAVFDEGPALLPFLLVPSLFVVIGLGFVFFAWKNRIAEMRLGDVQLLVEPRRAGPGQPLKVRLRLTPPRDLQVNGITATLRCKEICVSGSGTNKTTHRMTVFEDVHELVGSDTLPGRQQRDVEITVPLPPNAPASFAASNNQLRWEVAVDIDVPGWPDWGREVMLEVQPQALTAA